MRTVQSHRHQFTDDTWPFGIPQNALAITTKPIVEKNYPALLVSHDDDGVWQILCNTTTEADECMVVCIGCCFERDASIGELADLPAGWLAQREFVGGKWARRVGVEEQADEA